MLLCVLGCFLFSFFGRLTLSQTTNLPRSLPFFLQNNSNNNENNNNNYARVLFFNMGNNAQKQGTDVGLESHMEETQKQLNDLKQKVTDHKQQNAARSHHLDTQLPRLLIAQGGVATNESLVQAAQQCKTQPASWHAVCCLVKDHTWTRGTPLLRIGEEGRTIVTPGFTLEMRIDDCTVKLVWRDFSRTDKLRQHLALSCSMDNQQLQVYLQLNNTNKSYIFDIDVGLVASPPPSMSTFVSLQQPSQAFDNDFGCVEIRLLPLQRVLRRQSDYKPVSIRSNEQLQRAMIECDITLKRDLRDVQHTIDWKKLFGRIEETIATQISLASVGGPLFCVKPLSAHTFAATELPVPSHDQDNYRSSKFDVSTFAPISVPDSVKRLNPQSGAYAHVCHAFYASLAHMPAYKDVHFIVTRIEEIHNAAAKVAFESHKDQDTLRVAYHGTHPNNLASILTNNFSMDARGKTDSGWFGAGLYFSRYADYVMMYHTTGSSSLRPVRSGEKGKLIQVSLLPGRTCKLSDVHMGEQLFKGHDSHVSPSGFEHVMFDPTRVLPRFIISFDVVKNAGTNFVGSHEHLGVKHSASAASDNLGQIHNGMSAFDMIVSI